MPAAPSLSLRNFTGSINNCGELTINFYLVKPDFNDEKAVSSMILKWKSFGGRMNPGLLRNFDGDYKKFLEFLSEWENGINIGDEVPQTLFLLKNGEGTVLGAASLRHFLNKTNILDGGHVAYGIAPQYRKKGYGNLILSLALKKLREMKIKKVLVTCDSDNLASQAVILKNGGVFFNHTFDEDGVPINRYWIEN